MEAITCDYGEASGGTVEQGEEGLMGKHRHTHTHRRTDRNICGVKQQHSHVERLTVWVTSPGASGSCRLSRGTGLDSLEGEGLSVHTHWEKQARTHTHKGTGRKRRQRKEKIEGGEIKTGLTMRGRGQRRRRSWVCPLTWEGGDVEKEVVQTSCESWTPANGPSSSSSGALHTQQQSFR